MTTPHLPPSHTGLLHLVPRWLLAALAGIAPAVMTVALVGGYLKRNLFDFRPLLWNDQTYYWHQILTFSQVGFNGGYYMFYEKLPRIDFFHFGASGFLYPALYGTVAHFIGWQPFTGILLNMIGLAVACWLVIYVADFGHTQIVLTGLFLLSFGPLLLYVITVSQESFHQAAGLILAAIFYRLLQNKGGVSRGFMAASILFLVMISLVRFSWGLLFFPLFVLMLKELTWRRILTAFISSSIVLITILLVFQNTSAPGNNSVFGRVGEFSASPFAALGSLWNIAVHNLETIFTTTDIHHLPVATIGLVQFFILLLCLILGGRLFVNQTPHTENKSLVAKQLFFHIYNLGAILGASLIFYLSTGYYRVFAPYILLTGILLIAFRNLRLVIVLIVINLLSIGVVLNEYGKWDDNFIPNSTDTVAASQASFDQYLQYDAHTTNPWCNTLLTQLKFLDRPLTLIPPGIGVSFFLAPAEQPVPIKSQYLLLDDASYQVLRDRAKLTYLAAVNEGSLYRNTDAECTK